MAAEEVLSEDVDQAQDNQDVDGKPRERSTIKFPYGDLDDAVSVAKGVHEVGGSSCEWEQLAAHLKQASDGGGFRQKMLTAKLFGVVDYSQRKVTMAALGGRICDPKQEKAAKAEAFLTVPLYKAIYEKFKGNTLPRSSALESEMASLGVAGKQTEKARQYFQRSAEQAGFFWSGSDRLVMPSIRNGADTHRGEEEKPKNTRSNDGSGAGGGGGGNCDPAIQGLINRLPLPDQDWPLEKRAKWLLALSHAFDVVYPRQDDDRSLKIEIVKD